MKKKGTFIILNANVSKLCFPCKKDIELLDNCNLILPIKKKKKVNILLFFYQNLNRLIILCKYCGERRDDRQSWWRLYKGEMHWKFRGVGVVFTAEAITSMKIVFLFPVDNFHPPTMCYPKLYLYCWLDIHIYCAIYFWIFFFLNLTFLFYFMMLNFINHNT